MYLAIFARIMLRLASPLLFLVLGLFSLTLVRAEGLTMPINGMLRMDGKWRLEVADTQREINLPYISHEDQRAVLSYRFCSPDSFGSDSLYFWFEGLAWEADFMLGDAYLGMSDRPFGVRRVAIPPHLIRPGDWNDFKIILTKGESFAWHPEAFLAMLKAPVLLNHAQLNIAESSQEKVYTKADTVAIVAPYYRSYGYNFNLFEAVRTLQAVIDAKIGYVHFPFFPDRELQALCKQLGLKEISQLADTTQVCLINAYPYSARELPTQARFWLDEEAYRTTHYGDIRPLNSESVVEPNRIDHPIGLMLMLLFPLLSMFLLKILNPGYFSSQVSLLLNPKLHLSTSLDATGSNTGLLGILMILKGINLSMLVSLIIYYVLRENEWEQLNLIRDLSLLNQWFYGSDSLWQIFVKSIELTMIWFGLKYLFLIVLGRGFQIKGLVEGIMSLEIAASFPLILFLNLPIGLIIFMNTLWGGWAMSIFLLLGLLYLIRRAYVFFIGLERLFNFSSAVNFLYICALNLIPYLIWL
ncbi:MAG: DUF4271 domain-containing protein [Bacteroidia bacterium]